MLKDSILRIQQIDNLIKRKGTGSPDDFAARLQISRRCLYDYINKMRDWGAPIEYDLFRQTYYYREEGKFTIAFTRN
jgi:predicted DNA-binding transcriptional regulator YafY